MAISPNGLATGAPYQEALARGETRYISNLPCKNCSNTIRRVQDGKCATCRNKRKRLGRSSTKGFPHRRSDDNQFAWIVRHDPCSYCGNEGGTVDHIDPLASENASNSFDNMTGACLDCNNTKANRTLLAFLLMRTECRTTRRMS